MKVDLNLEVQPKVNYGLEITQGKSHGISGHCFRLSEIAMSPCGELMAVLKDNGSYTHATPDFQDVVIYSTVTHKKLFVLDYGVPMSTMLKFSPSGKYLIQSD